MVKAGEWFASDGMVPPPTPNTPCSRAAEANRSSRSGGYPVPHATRCPEEDDRSVARDTIFAPNELRKTIAPLFGHYVVMLAMQHRRAPVPVSSGLWKEIVRLGLPNNLDELAKLARRYLLIGDRRMLLAELRARPRIPRRTPRSAGRSGLELQCDSRAESGEKCKHS
jgi:hypothetical protein